MTQTLNNAFPQQPTDGLRVDVSYRERFGSDALNLKFADVLRDGVLSGFEVKPTDFMEGKAEQVLQCIRDKSNDGLLAFQHGASHAFTVRVGSAVTSSAVITLERGGLNYSYKISMPAGIYEELTLEPSTSGYVIVVKVSHDRNATDELQRAVDVAIEALTVEQYINAQSVINQSSAMIALGFVQPVNIGFNHWMNGIPIAFFNHNYRQIADSSFHPKQGSSSAMGYAAKGIYQPIEHESFELYIRDSSNDSVAFTGVVTGGDIVIERSSTDIKSEKYYRHLFNGIYLINENGASPETFAVKLQSQTFNDRFINTGLEITSNFTSNHQLDALNLHFSDDDIGLERLYSAPRYYGDYIGQHVLTERAGASEMVDLGRAQGSCDVIVADDSTVEAREQQLESQVDDIPNSKIEVGTLDELNAIQFEYSDESREVVSQLGFVHEFSSDTFSGFSYLCLDRSKRESELTYQTITLADSLDQDDKAWIGLGLSYQLTVKGYQIAVGEFQTAPLLFPCSVVQFAYEHKGLVSDRPGLYQECKPKLLSAAWHGSGFHGRLVGASPISHNNSVTDHVWGGVITQGEFVIGLPAGGYGRFAINGDVPYSAYDQSDATNDDLMNIVAKTFEDNGRIWVEFREVPEEDTTDLAHNELLVYSPHEVGRQEIKRFYGNHIDNVRLSEVSSSALVSAQLPLGIHKKVVVDVEEISPGFNKYILRSGVVSVYVGDGRTMLVDLATLPISARTVNDYDGGSYTAKVAVLNLKLVQAYRSNVSDVTYLSLNEEPSFELEPIYVGPANTQYSLSNFWYVMSLIRPTSTNPNSDVSLIWANPDCLIELDELEGHGKRYLTPEIFQYKTPLRYQQYPQSHSLTFDSTDEDVITRGSYVHGLASQRLSPGVMMPTGREIREVVDSSAGLGVFNSHLGEASGGLYVFCRVEHHTGNEIPYALIVGSDYYEMEWMGDRYQRLIPDNGVDTRTNSAYLSGCTTLTDVLQRPAADEEHIGVCDLYFMSQCPDRSGGYSDPQIIIGVASARLQDVGPDKMTTYKTLYLGNIKNPPDQYYIGSIAADNKRGMLWGEIIDFQTGLLFGYACWSISNIHWGNGMDFAPTSIDFSVEAFCKPALKVSQHDWGNSDEHYEYSQPGTLTVVGDRVLNTQFVPATVQRGKACLYAGFIGDPQSYRLIGEHQLREIVADRDRLVAINHEGLVVELEYKLLPDMSDPVRLPSSQSPRIPLIRDAEEFVDDYWWAEKV